MRPGLALLLTLGLLTGIAPPTHAQASCQFVLGFATLRDLVGPASVGACLQDQRFAPNGNAEQQTTGGLMVWRKADNWTAFTDGYRTWLNGPAGLQARLNSERFQWEGDVSGAVPTVATQQPPAPPLAAAAPTIAEVAARMTPSVVQIRTPSATGSGVRVAEGILTNAHVVKGAQSVEVLLPLGRRFNAMVVRRDEVADLALLATNEPIPSLELANVYDQKQGDVLLVIGYPQSLAGSPTLTTGILSAVRQDGNGVLYAQTDAAVNPGNSGGALVNMDGKLIALPTFGLRDTQGLNFGVSAETIKVFLTGRLFATPVPPTPTPVPFPPAHSVLPKRSELATEWFIDSENLGDDVAFRSVENWPGASTLPSVTYGVTRSPNAEVARRLASQQADSKIKSAPDPGWQIYEIESPGPAGSRAVMNTNGLIYQFQVYFWKGPYTLRLTVTGSSATNPSGPMLTWSKQTISTWLTRIAV